MVKAHGHDHVHVGVDDIGGVPTPAHANLHHGNVHRGIGERGKRNGHGDLEVAHRDTRALIHHLDVRLDLAVNPHEIGRVDRRSINTYALRDQLQMRAGGAPNAIAKRR